MIMDVQLNTYKPKSTLEVIVVENKLLSGEACLSESRQIILEWNTSYELSWRTGQSIGVLAPGVNAKGRAHPLRLYSIASPVYSTSPGKTRMNLCVKRVCWEDESGLLHRGVASNFLCDLKVGDSVNLCGPLGKHFLFDLAEVKQEILIGTGTGVAPFIARIRELLNRVGDNTKIWAIFGFRTQDSILYRQEIQELQEKYPERLRVDFVLSREQTNKDGSRKYCGDFIQEHPEIFESVAIQREACLYICGIMGMEVKIHQVFEEMCESRGLNWAMVKQELSQEHLWLQEVY